MTRDRYTVVLDRETGRVQVVAYDFFTTHNAAVCAWSMHADDDVSERELAHPTPAAALRAYADRQRWTARVALERVAEAEALLEELERRE